MIFVGIMLASTMNAVFRRILRSGYLTFQNRADPPRRDSCPSSLKRKRAETLSLNPDNNSLTSAPPIGVIHSSRSQGLKPRSAGIVSEFPPTKRPELGKNA
jgi:hypothetical protein